MPFIHLLRGGRRAKRKEKKKIMSIKKETPTFDSRKEEKIALKPRKKRKNDV